MNLQENIIDNIIECEAKIGYRKAALSLYYPGESLMELLGCTAEVLDERIAAFCQDVGNLDSVSILETSEAGRYQVTVSELGVEFVHDNYSASEFLQGFLIEIKRPGNKIGDIYEYFNSISSFWCGEQLSEQEAAVWFEEPEVDPYVYIVEENDFGLEYHRFTQQAYERLKA